MTTVTEQLNKMHSGVNDTLLDVAAAAEISISCHENEVPVFAYREIERLHGHLYCLPSYLDMSGQLVGASTYVVRQGGIPVTVLLYRRVGGEVHVLSEFVSLGAEDIRRFAAHMFSSYKSVKVVSFARVRTDVQRLPYPWHAVNYTEDMIVELPGSVKEYDARVGKNMRRNIKRYTNALQRDFPSYSYRVCVGSEVSEQDIRDIIRLSCIRMESKNIVPRFNEAETQWIVKLARESGLVGIATIDGKVCAGAIGFRIGENYFMHVIAHDPKYNYYSLGIVCYYHTICEGIARGAKRFHLLQGRYGYKYRLLAERHDILHIDVYRSTLQAALHGRRMLGKAINGHIHAVKQWLLHDVERAESRMAQQVGRLVNRLRQWRRAGGVRTKGEEEFGAES
ncbi:hypothetical protein GCM10027343_43700 [Noviherbaspirillum agri]